MNVIWQMLLTRCRRGALPIREPVDLKPHAFSQVMATLELDHGKVTDIILSGAAWTYLRADPDWTNSLSPNRPAHDLSHHATYDMHEVVGLFRGARIWSTDQLPSHRRSELEGLPGVIFCDSNNAFFFHDWQTFGHGGDNANLQNTVQAAINLLVYLQSRGTVDNLAHTEINRVVARLKLLQPTPDTPR